MNDTNPPTPVAAHPDRPLSFGERAVGLSFNPSGDPVVYDLKTVYAQIIDRLNRLRVESTDPEVKRMCAVAITEAQTSQMRAVKAATWRAA
jgi:hypothetical protein